MNYEDLRVGMLVRLTPPADGNCSSDMMLTDGLPLLPGAKCHTIIDDSDLAIVMSFSLYQHSQCSLTTEFANVELLVRGKRCWFFGFAATLSPDESNPDYVSKSRHLIEVEV